MVFAAHRIVLKYEIVVTFIWPTSFVTAEDFEKLVSQINCSKVIELPD